MKRAFTLIELLVVMAIIATLAALLFPVFAQAKQQGVATTCANNLRQVSLAWQLYAGDHDDTACPAYHFTESGTEIAWDFTIDWTTQTTTGGLLHPYHRTQKIHECPSFRGESWGRPTTGYGYNTTFVGGEPQIGRNPFSTTEIPNPSETAVFADCGFGHPVKAANFLRAPSDPLFLAGKADFRHQGRAAIAMADGRVMMEKRRFLPVEGEPTLGALSINDARYGADY